MKQFRTHNVKFLPRFFQKASRSLRVLNVQWTFVQHRPERSVDQRPQGSNKT